MASVVRQTLSPLAPIHRVAPLDAAPTRATGKLKVVARRYHLHFPGVVYSVTTIILVLGAINGQNNLLFWLFGLAVGGLIASGILSGAALMGIEVTRDLPPSANVGEESVIRYRVRNRNRLLPVYAITIEELRRAPLGLGPDRAPASWPRKIASIISYGPYVKPRGEAIVEARFKPFERGQATFDCVRVWTTFPFGLAKKSVTFGGPTAITIRPKVIGMDATIFDRSLGRGDRSVGWPRQGDDGEYYALREYVPGDPMRMIAWRPSSKRDTPLVRVNAQAGGSRVWIVLDAAGASGEPRFEHAVSVAAGLCVAGVSRGLRVGLASGDGRLLESAKDGPRHTGELLDALAVVQSAQDSGPDALEPGVRRITPTTVGRDGLIFVAGGPSEGQAPISGLRATGAWRAGQTVVVDAMAAHLSPPSLEAPSESSDRMARFDPGPWAAKLARRAVALLKPNRASTEDAT